MQVSLLLATRQTHLASAGVSGALFGWSVVRSRGKADARYYVVSAIRKSVMILSKVLKNKERSKVQ